MASTMPAEWKRIAQMRGECLRIIGSAKLRRSRSVQHPDRLANPSTEMIALTNNSYQKIAGSRAIAGHLNLETNRSQSFINLVNGIRKIIQTP
ncbi:MAG: hypothetical protein HQM02_02600 [Magnetococcales bacterium]|nr:hypothetical protein [Magnetococcales bacterium]